MLEALDSGRLRITLVDCYHINLDILTGHASVVHTGDWGPWEPTIRETPLNTLSPQLAVHSCIAGWVAMKFRIREIVRRLQPVKHTHCHQLQPAKHHCGQQQGPKRALRQWRLSYLRRSCRFGKWKSVYIGLFNELFYSFTLGEGRPYTLIYLIKGGKSNM